MKEPISRRMFSLSLGNCFPSIMKRPFVGAVSPSHMLSEIELMADDIGILNHGRLLFEGSLDDLRHSARQAGMSADNLEDVFLSIVERDTSPVRSWEAYTSF